MIDDGDRVDDKQSFGLLYGANTVFNDVVYSSECSLIVPITCQKESTALFQVPGTGCESVVTNRFYFAYAVPVSFVVLVYYSTFDVE
jgi:hypothetical protein